MRNYEYRSQRILMRKKKHPFRNLLLFFFLFLFFGWCLYSAKTFISQKKSLSAKVHMASPLEEEFNSAVLSVKTQTKIDLAQSTGLQTVVQTALAGTQGSYGVYIKNLKTGEVYALNTDTIYDSASLYKLWIMAVAFQEIQEGKLSESQTLSEDAEILNQKFDIDDADAEQTSGTISYTVHDALYRMITISDNYSALLLAENEKLSAVSNFLKANGFNESKVGTNGDLPITTASDVGLFFEKLYKGQLANKQYTNEMLDLLKAQALNEKMPKYLPDDTVIAHKTGELDDYSHDAGIIYSTSGDYILVVLTKTDSPPDAIERIAEVSKEVYNYFNNNPTPTTSS